MGQRGALLDADELGVGAAAVAAEDGVADLELGDRLADSLDHAGELHAQDLVPRPAEAGEELRDPWLPAAQASVGPVDRRGVDLDEDLVVRGHWPLDLREVEDLGWTVVVVQDRLHRFYRSWNEPRKRSNVARLVSLNGCAERR